MNLDELAMEIGKVSPEKIVQGLSRSLIEWKDNDQTAEQLKESIEEYFRTSWIDKSKDHERAYSMWSSFKDAAILGIGGMTMNERLYWFSLSSRFERCAKRKARSIVYRKLHAAP